MHKDNHAREGYADNATVFGAILRGELPAKVLFEDEQVPEVFTEDVAHNAKIVDTRDDFEVPEKEDVDPPSPEQISENKAKWGYDA